MADKNRKVRVIADHQASYADPLQVVEGDRVIVGSRDVEWPAFLWSTHPPSGKSGWVPEAYLALEGETGTLLRDYSARELSVRAGDVVVLELEHGGWCWVYAAGGEAGWIPAKCLAMDKTGGQG